MLTVLIFLSSGNSYNVTKIANGYKLKMQLRILKVDGSDFTTYKCVAKNPHGEADVTIRLAGEANCTLALTAFRIFWVVEHEQDKTHPVVVFW